MAKKRPFQRTDRLQSQVREVLALALQRETREELLRAVVITDVDVTNDVSLARVYWHALPGMAATDIEAVQAAFTRATGFLRAKLGEVVRARVTPDLRFIHDDALDRGRRIEDVLRAIERERPPPEPEVAASEPVDEAAKPASEATADEADEPKHDPSA